MIRLATLQDLVSILDIVCACISMMQKEKNTQWDHTYPSKDDFIKDVSDQTLYVYEYQGEVAGFVCLNEQEAEGYRNVKWESMDKATIIHRMAVNPNVQRCGIASALLKFAEQIAAEREHSYIKSDTCSMNEHMKRLFLSKGYRKVGEISHVGRVETFFCYEKRVSAYEKVK